ncbi:MAG: hypothetical protein CVV32_10590 [Methanomicrobiales archaeon HGW-Methanomicrobiales-3]|jgi:uncharacterized membrane protein|nr:MAG: hypothetical protein CVV32_10590 [Methanomicrobiales archaeon HGW-Methanomicrobiales-3]
MKISLSPNDFWELILSHHPNNPCFDDDVIILFGRRICAGCLFAYPTALVVLLAFRPTGPEAIIAAIALAIISQTRQLIDNRNLNFGLRFVAGIALGCGAGGLLWAVQAQNIPAVLLIFLFGSIYAIIRYYSMKARILECWEKSDEF